MGNKVKTAIKEPEVRVQEQEVQEKCRHYWLIESPNGPTSTGVCKLCGMVKEFYNSSPEFWVGKRPGEDIKPPGSLPGRSDAEEEKSDVTLTKTGGKGVRVRNKLFGSGEL